MDIYKTPQEKPTAKNLWNTMRLIFYIMKKRIINSKVIVLDLNTLLKRGKTASKAIAKLLSLRRGHSYYSALTCRSQDDVVGRSFVSPREYEFSCKDTPLFAARSSKRKQHYYYYSRNKEEDEKLMQKVLDILHRYDAVEATPAAASPMLPGFGQSPTAARQLRVSDSPFLLKDADEDEDGEEAMVNNGHKCYQVDKDAEEFIDKFYKDLKNQKRVAALESPSAAYDRMWAR